MEDILNNITNPKDLKKLNYEDKKLKGLISI